MKKINKSIFIVIVIDELFSNKLKKSKKNGTNQSRASTFISCDELFSHKLKKQKKNGTNQSRASTFISRDELFSDKLKKQKKMELINHVLARSYHVMNYSATSSKSKKKWN